MTIPDPETQMAPGDLGTGAYAIELPGLRSRTSGAEGAAGGPSAALAVPAPEAAARWEAVYRAHVVAVHRRADCRRLGDGVVPVSGPGLLELAREPGRVEVDDRPAEGGEQAPELDDLARVAGGEDERPHPPPSASFWRRTRELRPAAASSRRRSISSRLKGSSSAVPWISM